MRKTFGDILGQRLRAEHRPVLVARALRHADVSVTEVRSDHPTFERSESLPADDAYVAVLQLRDFPKHEWWEGGHQAPITALRAGQLTLYDLERDPRFRINHPFHSIHFHLPRRLLKSLRNETDSRADTELHYASGVGVDDPVFRHLALALQPAFAHPDRANRLFVDSITLAVAAHVATTYGRTVVSERRSRGVLSSPQQRTALALIDAHLDGELTIAELSRSCGLSTSYFVQAFKKTMGVTPHRWLSTRRVERAKQLLRDTKKPLAQIAFDCGFANQSHFTRVFSAFVGTPPGEWRRASVR